MTLLRMQGRYYRTIPPDDPGYEQEPLELEAARTCFVSLHCWDIGCPGGSKADENYCVGMGYPGVTREAYAIMRDRIRPALDAAREVNLAVMHVQDERIARKYPAWAEYEDDTETTTAIQQPGGEQNQAIPGHRRAMLQRAHGPNYLTESALADMDFPDIVAPLSDEPVVCQTAQFDRILRERDIVNLIYAGFAADMCILRAPGGIGPMFERGYRCVLMRDATLGVEPPDFLEDRIATRWGIRYHEAHWGDTITLADFLDAIDALGDA